VIVHTDVEEVNGETEIHVGIISARRATRREAKRYRG
jgi:uncharacterized DUF497 family protein